MKHYFISLTLLISFVMVKAQNNCPSYNINGSFEDFPKDVSPSCGGDNNQNQSVNKATGWNSILSADVYHSLMIGYQPPACLSGGKIHSGSFAAGFGLDAFNHEYIYRDCGSLITGAKYKVKAFFKTAANVSSNKIGIWMLNKSTVSTGDLTANAQLQNPIWTIDVINNPNGTQTVWDVYEANFTAASGNYMMCIGSVGTGAYYCAVDDVSLTLDKPSVSITNSASGPVCQGTCVNLTSNVIGGSYPLTYTWSNGVTTPGQQICSPTNTSISVTVKDFAGCTATSSSTNVVIISAPGANAGPDRSICGIPNSSNNFVMIGDPVSCGRGNPTSTLWSPSGYLSDPNICYPKAYPQVTTDYTVTRTDLVTGCVATDVVRVNVYKNISKVVADPGPSPLQYCLPVNDYTYTPSTLTIGTGPGLSGWNYNWSSNYNNNYMGNLTCTNCAQPTIFNSVNYVYPGSTISVIYTLVVTNSVGCVSDPKTVTVNYPPYPLYQSISSFTAGPNITIQPCTQVALQGTCAAGLTASWYPTSSILSGGNTCTPVVSPAGTTNYVLYERDVNGCDRSSMTTVTVSSGPACDVIGMGRHQTGTATSTKEESLYSLYPNPSTGQMQFNYSLQEGQQGKLMIVDLMGKQLSSYSMAAGENTLSINESSLPNGIYLYRVIVNNEVVKTDKISIIK